VTANAQKAGCRHDFDRTAHFLVTPPSHFRNSRPAAVRDGAFIRAFDVEPASKSDQETHECVDVASQAVGADDKKTESG